MKRYATLTVGQLVKHTTEQRDRLNAALTLAQRVSHEDDARGFLLICARAGETLATYNRRHA